ncbi:unnamed protein product, partial [Mesorhabditis belari]|uniref:DRBM domain-containing protein n=1 Tax=Mesorhabditis belari TaxID=2138241 RepID=A0AAF3FCV0_9BILA
MSWACFKNNATIPTAQDVDWLRTIEEPKRMNLTGNIVSFLEEASVKVHHQSPSINTLGERGPDNKPFFAIECIMSKYRGVGHGLNKKVAKINAVHDLLKQVIEIGGERPYGIQGNTKKERLEFIKRLYENSMKQFGTAVALPPVDVISPASTSPTTSAANYVGLLQEYCQKNKIPSPSYECDERGPDNMKVFKHTCKVINQTAESEDKTKKKSKNDAARKMYELLRESVQEMGKDSLSTEVINDEDETSENYLNEKTSKDDFSLDKIDAIDEFKELLKTSKVFSTPKYEFKDVLQLDSAGNHQTMLKMTMRLPGEAIESAFCYPGFGQTMTQAHLMAANHAVLLLKTYSNCVNLLVGETNLISL